ncbi:helix-turn-helix domain-containing protein [Chitinophaga filiformis]|uniref:Helix-turn-helix n=1 Tax=Chitinophaga filiformis TaxID=104663 RepID=A0A1G7MJX2_CHIFI|nr:helix-turn-helix transcriptional regulator [Chitinophaga filiformis]SDF62007.1 Helix-turn-helix [Chitinophaga filiformis]
MNLAKAIKDIRTKTKMNQRDFAAVIEISQTALSQIESGIAQPSDKTLERIANRFETTADVIKLAGLEVENDIPSDKQALFNELFPNFAEKVAAMIAVNNDPKKKASF